MDTKKITRQAATIERLMLALTWMQEYGTKGTDDDTQYSIDVKTFVGGSCGGCQEAMSILSGMISRAMPTFVAEARVKCLREIEVARSVIADEVSE